MAAARLVTATSSQVRVSQRGATVAGIIRSVSSSFAAARYLHPYGPTTEGTDTDGKHGNNLVHGQITNSVLSAAYKVHSRLGPGLLERPYRACMAYEFKRLGLSFEEEKPFPVIY